tara:strand:- start:9130 stop:9765 length:636 start_codon:yes stop_codon:yes gene_type:complete
LELNYAWYTTYILLLFFGAGFALVRKEVVLAFKRKFFTGKGYVYIRMWMPDRQEVEDFVNLKKSHTLQFFGRSFLFDASTAAFKEALPAEKSGTPQVDDKGKPILKEGGKQFELKTANITKRGKFPVFNFRWDKAEPIDPYSLQRKLPSDLFETAIMRAKAQGTFGKFLAQNSRIMMMLMGAVIAAAAAAWFSHETQGVCELILSRGVAIG